MPIQIEKAGALLDIPDLGRMVHRTSRCQHAMWVEAEAYNLLAMALQRISHLTCHRVPNLSCFIETSSHDEVAEWVIESHGINDILVLLETQQLCTSLGVPDTARPIVRASNEFITSLVEGTVGERQQVGS